MLADQIQSNGGMFYIPAFSNFIPACMQAPALPHMFPIDLLSVVRIAAGQIFM